MLQQQLRQKDEDIAAKAAEIGELKERVAELEKLRQDQQAMIALKDSELAAAQQRLAEANRAPAPTTPAVNPAVPTAATQQAASEAADAPASSPMPWLWGGVALVAMAMLAWLFVRRRPRAVVADPARRRAFDSDALAASLRAPADTGTRTAADADADADADANTELKEGIAPDPAPAPEARDAVLPEADAPAWHAGKGAVETPAPAAPPVAQPRFMPFVEPLPEPPVPKASVDHRMKLARAFLDIGDDHSAKQLLREIMDDVDPAAREDAARMLRELG